jgi:hypothetical protein
MEKDSTQVVLQMRERKKYEDLGGNKTISPSAARWSDGVIKNV